MLERILNCRFHLRVVVNPYIRYLANSMGKYSGVNSVSRETPVVLSITSYEERFDDLEIALYSLLNQTLKPDRIIIWLSDEYDLLNLPYSITKYVKNGLEIRFVKDIKSYTKVIYALKEFENSVIVTADDDVYYPKDWLEKLYHSYISHPEDIQVHRAHRVLVNDKKELLPYEKWKKHVEEESARFDNFLTGVGGVLYPPNCFTKEVFRDDIFLTYTPNADDIWLWFMALLSGRKIRVVKNHIKTLACTNILRQLGFGRSLYSVNRLGDNDKQISALMKFYKANISSKL